MLKDKLMHKMGGLPVIAWVGILAGGLLVARYLRAQSAANAAATTDTTDPNAVVDTTLTPDPLSSGTDVGLTGALPNAVQGGFVDPTNEAQTGALFDQLGQAVSALTDLAGVLEGAGAGDPLNPGGPELPATAPAPITGDGAPAANNPPAVRTPAPTSHAGVVIKTEKLKNGATLTYFADGRIEEQVPGKSAYVIKKATVKAPTRFVTPAWLGIADAPVSYGVLSDSSFGAGASPSPALSLFSTDGSPALSSDKPSPLLFYPEVGNGNPFTGGAPGGALTSDPEHNAYVTGASDVDPFNVTPTLINGSGSPGDRDAAYAVAHPSVLPTAYSPALAPLTAAPVAAAGHSVAMEAAAPAPAPAPAPVYARGGTAVAS